MRVYAYWFTLVEWVYHYGKSLIYRFRRSGGFGLTHPERLAVIGSIAVGAMLGGLLALCWLHSAP